MAEGPIEVVSAGVVVADHLCEPIDHVPDPGELVMANRLVLEIGGCASNVGVSLAKMGVTCSVCGCVGDDPFGKLVVETLQSRGVDTSGIRRTSAADTSQTLIVNVRGQDRRFIHCFGANGQFNSGDIRDDLVSQAKVLYVGGYLVIPALTPESLGRVFQTARQRGVITVLDVAVPGRLSSQPGGLLEQLRQILPHTDVFLPNDDEARLITARSDPLEQVAVFRDAGARTVVITMGEDGAVLVSDRVRLRAGAFRVQFVDGTGGGDAFDAGYICGLLRGYDPGGCLQIASALGASCVRAVGTTPGVFNRSECDAFLKENRLEITEL